MATERMLVTKALDERDLLKKRINDAIRKAELVTTKRPSDDKVKSGSSVQDFEKEAKAQLQKIRDLIDRYERIDSAILLANATEKIEVCGREMTRASAINLRKSLNSRGTDRIETDFKGNLISKLVTELDKARCTIVQSQAIADKQRDVMTSNLSSSDKKELSNESLNGIDTYCNNLVSVLVDPINAESTLKSLVDERDELMSNLDSAIKVSNATTYVEF